jgi:membrane fusion protein (multidrug efflux system)
MDIQSNKKRKLFFVVVSLVLIGALFALVQFIRTFSRVSTDDAYVQGRIHSIAPKVSGTVSKVYVDDNQSVKKGDLLVEVDAIDYEVKAAEATAALSAERAKLTDAFASIKTARASLQIQKVTLHQATLDKRRAEALFKEGVIAKERFEKAMTAYNLAVAQLKAAKELLEKAQSLEALEESLIQQRQASLKTAQLNYSYTKIYSPSDGYVTNKFVEEGNQIAAGQPLMAIVALDDIWVVANFKETQLKNVHPGQQVVIKVDTFPGKTFLGRVDSIMAGTGAVFSLFPPENALGNYVKVVQRIPVKIVFEKGSDSQHNVRIGMSCVPTIITKNE